MRWTICYGMMFVSLGSVLVYTIANADDLRSPFGDTRAFVANARAPESAVVVRPATPTKFHTTTTSGASTAATTNATASAAPAASGDLPAITPGMTLDEVSIALGEPDEISGDGSRWTYGATILIFNSEGRLSGSVAFDPVQAAINKYNNMMVSITNDADSATPSRSVNGGPKILTRGAASNSVVSDRYRSVTAASSRDAYRYNSVGNEYSYYMNRYGPMDRVFLRKPSLPRGMTTVYDRNVGSAYQAFGNRTRYSGSTNIQYRR